MKRYKRIYVLLGVLVVACLATFGVTRYEEHRDTVEATGDIILEIPTDTVTSLSWTYEGESFSFHKDDTWVYDADEVFPVDEEQMNALLDQFSSLGAAFRMESVEDLGQYGLDDPICTIELTAGETEYTITLGDYSVMDEQRYLSLGDGTVYLVTQDPMEVFDCQLSDLIHHDEIPAFDTVSTITWEGVQNYQIFYDGDNTNTYSAEDVYFTEQAGETVPLDTDLVEDYLSTLHYLSLTDYVTYQVTEEELASYGLDTPDLTVTVEYTQEDQSNTFTLSVGRNPEEVEAAQEDEEKLAALPAYVRVGDSAIVYEIAGGDYEQLMAVSYDDLRHKEVLWADFGSFTQMDVVLDGETYTLTTEGTGENTTWYYGETELDTADIQSAFSSLVADSFTQEQPTGQEEISLTVYLEQESNSTVQIGFYRYDGENCVAVVDGTPVSLVPRSAVVDLMEAIRSVVL